MLTTNLTATSPTINISSSTGSLEPVGIASNLKLLDLVGGETQVPMVKGQIIERIVILLKI